MNYLRAVELTPVPNVVRLGKGKTAVLDLNEIIFIFDRSVEKFDKQQVTLFIYDVGEQSTKTFYLFLTKVPFIVLL